MMQSCNSIYRGLGSLILGLTTTIAATTSYAADTLKWAHIYETDTPMHQQALWAAEEFNKRTDSRYEIKVYPASSLGKQTDIEEGLSFGTVDVIYTGTQFAGRSYGPIGIGGAPYIFRDYDHLIRYRDSDLFQELSQGYYKATGNLPLAMNYYGERHVTSNHAINTPLDMAALKIRTPDAPMYTLFPKAVDANPTPIAFSEVYLALQQNVVDAQENPLHIIRSKRIYEVQKYINLTGHISDSLLTLVSGQTWKKLSDADRTTLKEILVEAALRTSNEVRSSEEHLISWFEEQGIKVNQLDRAPFREAVLPHLTGANVTWSDEIANRLEAL